MNKYMKIYFIQVLCLFHVTLMSKRRIVNRKKHFAQGLELGTHLAINVSTQGIKLSCEEGSIEDKSGS